MSLLTETRALKKQISHGQPQPVAKPTKLPLSAIGELPEVFQHRRPLELASKRHIRELAKVILRGQALMPITVYWAGTAWLCIDGHHRLGAYRLTKWKKPVPVFAFSGSLDEALNRAAMNSYDRLQMHRSEKANAAWRLTVATGLSKAQVMQSTGTSDGTLGHMRRVHKRLRDNSPGRDLSELVWEQARKEYHGELQVDIDYAELQKVEAQRIANTLIKTFGNRPHKQPEAFADGLEIFFPGLPAFLAAHWRELLEPEIAAIRADFVENDF